MCCRTARWLQERGLCLTLLLLSLPSIIGGPRSISAWADALSDEKPSRPQNAMQLSTPAPSQPTSTCFVPSGHVDGGAFKSMSSRSAYQSGRSVRGAEWRAS
eukprot:2457733-Pleurochrysis_carterae.AAC.1